MPRKKKGTIKVLEKYKGSTHYTKENGQGVAYVLGEVSEKVLWKLYNKDPDGVGKLMIVTGNPPEIEVEEIELPTPPEE